MSQPELMISLSTARALLSLQPDAVAARDAAGPVPLAASREAILEAMEKLRGEAVVFLREG